MIFRNFVICLLFISNIKSININLSLDNKNKDDFYPFIIDLNEPLRDNYNPIDLFVVFDISKDMDNKKDTLINILKSIIDNLLSDDRLCLIYFDSDSKIYRPLSSIDNEKFLIEDIINNKIYKSKFLFRNENRNYDRNYVSAIKNLMKEIEKSFVVNNGRVQSVIFIVSGYNTGREDPLKYLRNYENIAQYDFTMHTLCLFDSKELPDDLIDFSQVRDGTLYTFKSNMETQYALNIIKALRTTKYKNVNISIKSNYNITKFYGSRYLPYSSEIYKKNIFFPIFQFITGKEYTYVLLLELNKDEIKVGERILFVNINYTDFKGNTYKSSKSLRFYNSINYFTFKKDEYCRVKALEIVDKFKDMKYNIEEYKKSINNMDEDCNNYLNVKIGEILKEIGEKSNFTNYNMNGILAEGFLKKGGINFLYSNDYQLGLIGK